MSANGRAKPWFFSAFYCILEDAELKPGEKIVLLNLVGRSNAEGLYWIQREKQAAQTALTREGQAKILKRLKEKGRIDIQKIRPGDLLPNGQYAIRVCYSHQLTARIIEAKRTEEQNSGEQSSGETDNGEHGSREQNTKDRVSGVQITPTQGNNSLSTEERDTPPLHGLDLRKIKKEKRTHTQAHAPDRPLKLKERLKKLSLDICENKPIDPSQLRMLVAEAKEDQISLPPELDDALSDLQKHGLIELTRIGKIERIGWTKPTPLPTLLNGKKSQKSAADLDALVAETTLKLRM
jgi:hypothetical protein